MSNLIIEMDTDNAAFHEQGGIGYEIARILRGLADRIEYSADGEYVPLMDINGNNVGSFSHYEDE